MVTLAASALARDGFVLHDRPLVDREILEQVEARVDAVVQSDLGKTESGAGVLRLPVDGPTSLVKINQAHTADDVLWGLVTQPAIGAFVADVTGASMVQLWASQLLYKPPGGEDTGNVGWHQDQNYWSAVWTGEVFTLWLAISDVAADMGPLLFVRGSNRWGERSGGNFYGRDLALLQQAIVPEGERWDEVPGLLPAGGASIHHKLTVHGSGPNRSDRPRRGIALHLRTDRSAPVDGATHPYVTSWMHDHSISPVLFER